MSKEGESFFTSVGCMDGRVQGPVLGFGQERFKAKFADTITEAGLVGLLSQSNIEDRLFKSLKEKIRISLGKHHSKGIIVHGHEECAGNPVDDKRHKKDVLTAVELISSLFSKIEVVPVFVERESDRWVAKEIKPSFPL